MPRAPLPAAAIGLPNATPLPPTLWTARHMATGERVHVVGSDRLQVRFWEVTDPRRALQSVPVATFLAEYQGTL